MAAADEIPSANLSMAEFLKTVFKPGETICITKTAELDEGKWVIAESPGASLSKTVPGALRPGCWRRSTKPSIGSDSWSVSLSVFESPDKLRFPSGSAKQ